MEALPLRLSGACTGVSASLLPHQVLAFCMALHPRLGRDAPVAQLPLEVLRCSVLKALAHVRVNVNFKNFRRMLEPSWITGLGHYDTRLIHPPTFHTLGRVFDVNTHSQSLGTIRMRRAWDSFLRNVIGGLFFHYTIVFHGAFNRSPDWAVLVFESCPQRMVFGNDAGYVQGLITGFFASYEPPDRASRLIQARDDFPIVVRPHGDRLQTLIFGKYVPRNIYLRSSTFSTPADARRLLQADTGALGGWYRLFGAALCRMRTKHSAPFTEAARRGEALDCVLE